MNHVDLIFVVLLLLYAVDVFWLLPPGSIAFLTSGQQLRVRCAADVNYGFSGLELLFTGVLPSGRAVVAEFDPFTVADNGIQTSPAFTLPPAPIPSVSSPLINFEAMRPIERQGTTVRIASGSKLRFSSPHAANAAHAVLSKLAKGSPVERHEILERWVNQSFDVEEVARRWRGYRVESMPLMVASSALWLIVFGLAPLVYYFGVPVPFLVMASLYVSTLFWVAWFYWQAHRSLFPKDSSSRWTQTLLFVVSPVEAMVAPKILGRSLMAGLNPLAVVCVLGDQKDFEALAARVQRGLISLRTDSGEYLRQAILRFFREQGLEPDTLVARPEPDPSSSSFCPRCSEQYTFSEGACPACLGIEVVKF